ncbi:hypothetical protein V1L52_12150 [Treponema sp. HNW]|uniref:hypothetical protein n=1 Tax=unclassified Treponema TaxID=2638727 RepID=UPI003D11D9FD
MPTLQVRNLPNAMYRQIHYLAQKEQKTITEQTISLLQESINEKIGNKNRRKIILKKMEELDFTGEELPHPAILLREDRER